jgi:hypothetical protein
VRRSADASDQDARQLVEILHEKIYSIDEIKAALTYAQQARRHGKILVAPNGPVA